MSYLSMTIFGFLFIFGMTTLGATLVVFFKRDIGDRTNSIFLGFASGIMVASSVWSLIVPAIEGASYMGKFAFVPAVVGIVLGSLFLILLERLVPSKAEDVGFDKGKVTRLFVAVTVHNIPEGLAVGFAFGAAATLGTLDAYMLAMGLAIGIGVQNFPEGAAVALPIKGVSGSRAKGFLYGGLSGVVEPIFAVVGYFLATYLVLLQPWLLTFAAGAMLFVVADDLMPEASLGGRHIVASLSFIVGFILMMTLDVALG